LAAAGLAVGALGAGFCGFTGTFDVMGFGLGGGRVAFLATTVLRTAFLGIAFPGFLAALIGFFEGI
jgi:quinol-cytochrome oxidoreductase complex cytochrome b subunit